ncbi:MAG: AraC family transcriptional regulator [Spirochaetes bacterium]|nr:AraC family transcriptional regulator [Spirochaetota bacterium]
MPSKSYLQKINAVTDYIESNLDSALSLEVLSKHAGLSKFHFHRIFSAFTGETLYGFILRLRIEKAASLLVLNGKKNLTDIAFSCGFNDSATFSRAFKKHFGISASSWKKAENSKIHQDFQNKTDYSGSIERLKKKVIPINAELKTIPEMTIAYVRYTGKYKGDAELFHSLFKRILSWAEPRGFALKGMKQVIIYHDSPEITDESKLRLSCGIVVPHGTKPSGIAGILSIPQMKYLVCRFRLKDDEYAEAWHHVFRYSFQERNCRPAEGSCFETYSEGCFDEKNGLTEVEICVPAGKLT